jgi:transcriptional regulator with XRE-family HTH domain
MEQLILGITDHRAALGGRLRAAIYALNENQVTVAAALNTKKNHVGNWLRGDSYPGLYLLYQFSRIYGVSADWLILGDPSSLKKSLLDRVLEWERESAALSAPARKVSGRKATSAKAAPLKALARMVSAAVKRPPPPPAHTPVGVNTFCCLFVDIITPDIDDFTFYAPVVHFTKSNPSTPVPDFCALQQVHSACTFL